MFCLSISEATTTMIFHIQQEHPHINLKCSLNDGASGGNSVQSKKSQPQQKTLASFCKQQSEKSQMSVTKQQKLEKTLINLFVDKMLPISLLEHSAFKAFVAELDPRFKIPCRQAMIRKISDSYNNAVALLRHDLSGCASVSLTHDSWTSLMTESFDTITVHYINADWELHSGVLQTSHFAGKHTGNLLE